MHVASGHVVAAPARDRLVRWPAAFGTRFTIFCDVEEEFDWSQPLDRAQRSTQAIRALPEAHRRFADRGVGLTYMVDYPVAADPAALAIVAGLLADGRSAIGAQLHPWVNPPHDEPVGRAASFAGNLPRALEAAKIDALLAAIARGTGRRPLAYRAGRYGIGPHTLALLAERGIRLDSSVRPGYDYRGEGGPSFAAVGNAAWREDGVVELPFTTVFTGALRRGGGRLHVAASRVRRGPGVLARTGLLNRVPLTPEGVPIGEALRAVDQAIGDGLRLLAFSFHSPSLESGHTPNVRDAADLARFHRWWGAMLAHLDRAGVKPASLADILAAAG